MALIGVQHPIGVVTNSTGLYVRDMPWGNILHTLQWGECYLHNLDSSGALQWVNSGDYRWFGIYYWDAGQWKFGWIAAQQISTLAKRVKFLGTYYDSPNLPWGPERRVRLRRPVEWYLNCAGDYQQTPYSEPEAVIYVRRNGCSFTNSWYSPFVGEENQVLYPFVSGSGSTRPESKGWIGGGWVYKRAAMSSWVLYDVNLQAEPSQYYIDPLS